MTIKNSTGFVGIGITTPQYLLDVNGVIRVQTTTYSSDERLKENIKNMNGALSSLSGLHGVTYKFKANGINSLTKINSTSTLKSDTSAISTTIETDTTDNNRVHIGFLAQDVQKVFPELVYADKNGMLSVDYVSLIPVLVESIKELATKSATDSINFQNKLADLQKRLNQCCNTSKTKSAEVTTNVEPDASVSQAMFYQNIPNPFSQNTEIRYYLPDEIRSASLYIYNMQGAQIKGIPILTRGNGSEIINGSELNAGMYLYSLIADGKEIDTKRMILTQ